MKRKKNEKKYKETKKDRMVMRLAKFMHDEYELASRELGWKTQKKTRVGFSELPSKNIAVMFWVAEAVINYLKNTET